jgi:alpha-D-xyloside xylohydrolase
MKSFTFPHGKLQGYLAADVADVRDGGVDSGPHYDIHSQKKNNVDITQAQNGKLSYRSGPLRLSIDTEQNNLGFVFDAAGEKLTGHSFRSIGYVADQTTEKSRYDDGLFFERQGYMLAGLDLGVGEKLYGLGERFGPFMKNGQSVDIWNEDGGTSSELVYKNIPFYLSSKGYGVFVNHPGKVSFELQSERTTRVNISVPDEEIQYFIVHGGTPKEVLNRYTQLTGRPSLPPAWSYALWLTTSKYGCLMSLGAVNVVQVSPRTMTRKPSRDSWTVSASGISLWECFTSIASG